MSFCTKPKPKKKALKGIKKSTKLEWVVDEPLQREMEEIIAILGWTTYGLKGSIVTGQAVQKQEHMQEFGHSRRFFRKFWT